MSSDNVAIDVAAEQYRYWKSDQLTLREMVDAAGRSWHVGMTGDDVVIELAASWNALARDAIAGRLDAFLESCAYVRWVPHHRVDAALASGWRRPAGPPVLSRHSFHALLLEWDGEAGEEVPDIVGAEP